MIANATAPLNGSIKATAARLVILGLWIIIVEAEAKKPIGQRWGLNRRDIEEINRQLARRAGANLGIVLGPGRGPGGSWIVDFEGDGDQAEESLLRLLGGEVVSTMSWRSRRGIHRLFVVDGDRLLELLRGAGASERKGSASGVFKLDAFPELEIRCGGYHDDGTLKQLQSLIPPSMTDGFAREWIAGPESLTDLPEAAYAALETIVERKAIQESEANGCGPTAPEKKRRGIKAAAGEAPRRQYALKTLERISDEIARAIKGHRHSSLRDGAMNAAGLVQDEGVTEEEYRRTLWDAAKGNDLAEEDPGDVVTLIDSALVKATKRDLSKVGEELKAERRASGLPEIVVDSRTPEEGLKAWTPQALEAVGQANAQEPRLFQRHGILSRILRPEADGPPSIDSLTLDAARGMLDRFASWGVRYYPKKGPPGTRWGPPAMEIVRDLLALGAYPTDSIPPLLAVCETPVFLPDGRLVLTPGYSREGRLYYAPPEHLAGLAVPSRPMSREVEWALSLLLDELLPDFPFADEASRANAIALMLLPFVRAMIAGPTPNHHVSAQTEGTGKGLLAAACAFPALGREPDLTSQKESEAEWRKAITSAVLSGARYFFVDNMFNPTGFDDLPMPVDSGTLAMAWTSRYYSDRILGSNREVRAEIQMIFMSTGNNVAFSRELVRRMVMVELVANDENPSLRTGFRHSPLLDWARENHRDLVAACLVLCQHWIAEGMPRGSQTMGSYEAYTQTIGGILGACGVEGFLANRPQAVTRDPDAVRWNAFVEAWERSRKWIASTADLHDLIRRNSDLCDTFLEVIGDGSPGSQKVRLGKALALRNKRVYGKWRIVRSTARTHDKSNLWRLQGTDEPIAEDAPEDQPDPDSAF